MRYLITILWLLFLTPSIQAQIYKFKTYNTTNGLPNNAVYYILQDSSGYMWFATNDGVCRYDGLNYQSFTVEQGLADNSVRAIVEDKTKKLWFITRGGISSFDGKTFTNFTVKEGLPENEVRSGFCSEDGTLWFGTTKGLSRFDGKIFTNFGTEQGLPNSPVWKILETKPNELWLGLRGKGLAKFDGKNFTVYGVKDGLFDENVFDLVKDTDSDGLWIATDGGLYHFKKGKFNAYKIIDGLCNERVSSVHVDSQNRVWCGTYGGGICRLENGQFAHFNRKSGLPDDFITAHAQDFEGNIWWGTQRGGVFHFLSEKISNYNASSGFGDGTISGVSQSKDGTLWFSSFSSGLISFRPNGSIQTYTTKDGLLENELWAVLVDSKNRIWVGGHKGVVCYSEGKFITFSGEQIGIKTRITAFLEDFSGRIWMGSDSSAANGIIAYDGVSFTRYDTNQGLVKNQVNGFGQDRKGNLWVCAEGGLSCFDGTKFTNFTTKDGLPNKYVHRFYEDEQGIFWVGLAGGVSKFDGKTFTLFTTKDGLADNSIRSITSHNGQLWIGTLRGVSVFDGKNFVNYTVKEGLTNDSITNGIKSHIDNSFWFTTTEGVVHYQLKNELIVAKAPLIHLTNLSAGNELLDPQPTYSLPYNQNNVRFDFVALSFVDEQSVFYSYLLGGFDDKWSEPAKERVARFTNLPPGQYKFLVKASSAFGIWSQPVPVTLIILPPYWQTWWFRLVVLVFVVLSIYGVYTWRISLMARRYQRRILRLRQLLESIQVINSQLELKTVLQDIAAQSANLISAEPGGIGLVEDDKIVFHRLWIKDHWEDDTLSFPLEATTIASQAVIAAQTIVINQPTETELAFPEKLKKFYQNGYMDVPIVTRTGKVVGVLDVRRRIGRPPFTKLDQQLTEALANQAAVAIENAALYGELEKLYRNEQEITRTLQELDKMKTNFVILASHEMRTPLTILKGYHDVLLNAPPSSLTKMQERSLFICQRTVDRLIAIANDILEMLKISEGQITLKPSNVNLVKLAEEVTQDLSGFVERRKQKLTLSCQDPTIEIFVDSEKLRLILLNLLQNSIKFTHDDGEINISLTQDAKFVQIVIQDTGIGISELDLDRIFDKFYTGTDLMHHSSGKFEFGARGAGLGLAIAKSYVEAHQGKIWAESEGTGKGSKFHISLPKK